LIAGETDEDALTIPSWKAYRNFWNKEYPDLRVSRPTEDICSLCYQFQNSFRYRKQPTTDQQTADDDADDEYVDVDVVDDEGRATHQELPGPPSPPLPLSLCTTDVLSSDDEDGEEVLAEQEEEEKQEEKKEEDEDDVDVEVLQREKQIDDAVKLVRMARAQCQLGVNDKTLLANKEARFEAYENRVHTFIVDYGQNMALPWFGTSQPGDTYYYTPLTIFNLGVVDVSHPDGEHLYCHLYK
jgi:hypothetical protein